MANYKETQCNKQINLIKDSDLFEKAESGGEFRGESRNFVLQDGSYNLYKDIRKDAIDYYKNNDIKWWCLNKDACGHILSSQVACLNHLFPLRKDPEILKTIINTATGREFEEILPIPKERDNGEEHYIAFEVVSFHDNLNEKSLSRGANNTSIDALMIAKDKNQEVWIIPIEWKYTEPFSKKDMSNDDRQGEPKGSNGRGEKRMNRYDSLIRESTQLNHKQLESYQGSPYYQESFYQLMRQTLWAEQVIKKESAKWHNAKKFFHINIIPDGNPSKEVISKWKDYLTNQDLYTIIDPKKFLEPIKDKDKYNKLYDYLKKRYWE